MFLKLLVLLGAGSSCHPDLLLLLLGFLGGMLGFPDSITPIITVIIYEAGECSSDSDDQQLARSQHTACLLLRPFIAHTFFSYSRFTISV